LELPQLKIPLSGLPLHHAGSTRSTAEELQRRAQDLAGDAPSGTNDASGLRQVANQFEALFYGQLIRAMRSTVPENGFWGQGGGSKIYRQLHDQALADRMADSGGLGIAELIVRQFQNPVDGSEQPTNQAIGAAHLPAAYRRHAAVSKHTAAMVRLQESASALGGAAQDSLHRWQREVAHASQLTGLDPALILAVMVRESGGDPEAVSTRGARGLMQLMPDTALEMGVADPADPLQNLLGGSRYLAAMLRRYQGDLDLALAAYNAGPGTVDRLGRRIPNYPETIHYVAAVKDLTQRLGGNTGTNLVSQP
jgi:soluble lytic murein transglycosylase-like protein